MVAGSRRRRAFTGSGDCQQQAGRKQLDSHMPKDFIAPDQLVFRHGTQYDLRPMNRKAPRRTDLRAHRAGRLDDHGGRRRARRHAARFVGPSEREARHLTEMAVRPSKAFGDTEESWLARQGQYDLAHVRRDRIRVKRLDLS
jgi:hypothetical protein